MGHQPKACSVIDIGRQGFVVVAQERLGDLRQNDVAPLLTGDRVDVVLSMPDKSSLRISANVDAVVGNKLQLVYQQQNDLSVRRLLKFAKGDRQTRRGGSRTAVLDDIRHVTNRSLRRSIDAVASHVDETLFSMAKACTSNQEQQNCFDALSQLHASRKKIVEEFVSSILEKFNFEDVMSTPPSEHDTKLSYQDLSVVDKSTYEDWLAVNSVVDRIKARYQESLSYLQKRYSLLQESVVPEDELPFGITQLCRAFHGAVSSMMIDRALKPVLYQCFEEKIETGLEGLYSDINNCFRDHGILTDLEDLSADANKITNSEKKRAADVIVTQDEPHSEKNVLNFASASDQGPASGDEAVKLYSAVKNLMSLRRQSQQLMSAPVATSNVSSIQQPMLMEQDLIDVLSNQAVETEAMHAVAAGIPLVNWITAHSRMEGSPSKLNVELEEQVDLVASIFENIIKECEVSDTASPLIKQLEVPYLKMVLSDKEFLEDHVHPARQLLNQLAEWSSYSDISPRIVESRLENISKKLTKQAIPGRELFEQILQEVNTLISNQQSAHTRNAQRIARSYDGQEKLENAHAAVKEALSKRLLGRRVPTIMLSLLDAGWRDLLIQTYFKTGQNSREWSEALSVIDQLLDWLDEDSERGEDNPLLDRAIEAESFIDLIGRELDAAFPGQYKHVSIVKELRHLLCRDFVDYHSLEIVELNPKDNWYGIELAKVKHSRNKEKDKNLHRWYVRAGELEVGDWLGNVSSGDRHDEMLLAWRSQDGKQFAFVNRQGQKVADLMLWELAEKMKQGWQQLDKSKEWKPVDRSLYGVLQKVYDELDYHRCHDELTGLINRKEFENVINRTLYVAKRGDTQHVLFNVNIDQFNVVNDYCGVVAGDQCLKEISRMLQSELPKNAVMARFGGNEFAVMLESCNGKKGFDIAEKIRQTTQNYRFDWQGKNFSFTASIGMVVMDQFSESFVNLFKDINSACNLAKEEGRNRIIWSKGVDDKRRKRDDVLEWVARINRALDEDRLALRCQKIQPLNSADDARPHYEILLSVQEDNKDVLVPPDKFIEAAERYNRMQDVDRWVVCNTLNWMASNPDKLNEMHSISVNLSGNTMNDEYFLDFLNEQFARFPEAPERLCFEVTETATIANLSKAADFITEVKKLGCKFALDDFGTGMSSYEYLKRLPVDYLKIDGVFIKDITNSPFDFAVVKSINEIGQFMGKKTIAEYVEDTEILELLQEIGVDYAQGYGVEKPRLLSEI